jgi:hypothetical protein
MKGAVRRKKRRKNGIKMVRRCEHRGKVEGR